VTAHLWVWLQWLLGAGLVVVVGLVLSIVLWRRRGWLKRLLALVVFVVFVVSPPWMARAALEKESARFALRESLVAAGASERVAELFVNSPSGAFVLQSEVDDWRREHGFAAEREAVLVEVLLALVEFGALRLSAGELVHFADLMVAFAKTSTTACVATALGEVTPRQWIAGLERMAPEEQRELFRLAARAGKLELREEPAAQVVTADELASLRRGLERVLTRGEAAWLEQTLDNGAAADSSYRCQAYLMIARGATQLPAPSYRVAMRYLAAPATTP